jgi:hypothetical protein
MNPLWDEIIGSKQSLEEEEKQREKKQSKKDVSEVNNIMGNSVKGLLEKISLRTL